MPAQQGCRRATLAQKHDGGPARGLRDDLGGSLVVVEPLAVEEEDVVADAQLTGAVCRASGHDVRQYWREVGRRVRMAVDVLDRDPEGAFLE